MRWLLLFCISYTYMAMCHAQTAAPTTPFTDMVTDYGRPLPVWQNGRLSESYMLNAGVDVYRFRGNKPVGLLMGGRFGILKNDGIYVQEASQQIWGTKLQAAFVAGAKLYRMAGKHVVEGGMVAGPVHLANIEIGSFDKPLSSIITETFVYISLFSGTYIGTKFIYYPVFFNYKLQPIGGSALSAVSISLRVAI